MDLTLEDNELYNMQCYTNILNSLGFTCGLKRKKSFNKLWPIEITYRGKKCRLAQIVRTQIKNTIVRRKIEGITKSKSNYIVFANTNANNKNIEKLRSISSYDIANISFKSSNKISAKANYRKREEMEKNIKGNSFDSFIKKMVFRDMPIAFLEGFNQAKKKAKIYRRITPALIVTQGAWQIYHDFAIWVIHEKRKGAMLLGLQHAANSPVYSCFDWLEKRVSQYFITWGWGRGKMQPLPSLKYSNIHFKKSGEKDAILIPQAYTRLFPNSIFVGFYFLHDENCMREFLESLDGNLLNKVTYRQYPGELNTGVYKDINAKFSCLSRDNLKLSFLESVAKSRTVVVTYFGNTFMEALLVNKPTIIINNTGTELFTKGFYQDFNKLIELGIAYTDPKEAARFLNRNYSKIEEWWNEPKRQQLINMLCEKYIRTVEDPWLYYESFFRKVLETNNLQKEMVDDENIMSLVPKSQ